MRFSAFALLIAAVAAVEYVVPKKYPLYKQCDLTWATDWMGNQEREGIDTICRMGCAMSSLAMALAGKGILINGTVPDPQVLNQWLRANEGYKCINNNCNNLVLDAPDKMEPAGSVKFISEVEKPDVETLAKYVLESQPVGIAHVENKHHFVLLIGVQQPLNGTDTEFVVHDPRDYLSFTRTYSEMSDLILYNIEQQ